MQRESLFEATRRSSPTDRSTVYYINAHRRYKVSCELALRQLNAFLDRQKLDASQYTELFRARSERYEQWRSTLRSAESPSDDGVVRVPYVMSRLRNYLPGQTTLVIEAVTNAIPVIHHLNLTKVSLTNPHVPQSLQHDPNSLSLSTARHTGRDRRRRPRMAGRRRLGRQAGEAAGLCRCRVSGDGPFSLYFHG